MDPKLFNMKAPILESVRHIMSAYLRNALGESCRRLKRLLNEWRRWRLTEVHVPTVTYGTPHYGAWTICPLTIGPRCIVYSFGVGEDVSWDLAMIRYHAVTVRAFDPTPRSIAWVRSQYLPTAFRFYPVALADCHGMAAFHPPKDPSHISHTLLARTDTIDRAIQVPVKRLTALRTELGHTRIDILKMDIEGAEYAVIEDILRDNIDIGQILVEFHHRFQSGQNEATELVLNQLRQFGYRTFNVSPSLNEFSLIRIDLRTQLKRSGNAGIARSSRA